VPALNVKPYQLEVDYIEEWAKDNNWVLNRSKSADLVNRTKSRRSVVELTPAVPGFATVEWLKQLGVQAANTPSTRNAIKSHQHCVPSGAWSQAVLRGTNLVLLDTDSGSR